MREERDPGAPVPVYTLKKVSEVSWVVSDTCIVHGFYVCQLTCLLTYGGVSVHFILRLKDSCTLKGINLNPKIFHIPETQKKKQEGDWGEIRVTEYVRNHSFIYNI